MSGGEVILRTPRLLLRTFSEDDLDALAAITCDPVVMRFYPKLWDRADTALFIERQLLHQEKRGHSLWAVIHVEDNRLIGFCGLVMQEVAGGQHLEVGYMLDPAYWRRGLATEAARACLDFAFDTLGAPQVISLIRPENIPSQGVARKNGLRPERPAEFRGMPHLVFVMDASRWPCEQVTPQSAVDELLAEPAVDPSA